MRLKTISLSLALVTQFALVACGSSDEQPEGPTASATVALTQVPSNVSCISITAAGTRTVTKAFDVMAGQSSASLALNGLPTGSVTFSGSAYSTACSSVGSMSTAAFVADPVMATLTLGTPATVNLAMRKNATAQVNVDFEGDTCSPAGASCDQMGTACCDGLICTPDATGVTTCQGTTMCANAGAVCSPSTPCCGGLSCTGNAMGATICQSATMCTNAGAACNPTTPCCAGLSCTPDATGVTICQSATMCAGPGAACGQGIVCCGGLSCTLNPNGATVCQ